MKDVVPGISDTVAELVKTVDHSIELILHVASQRPIVQPILSRLILEESMSQIDLCVFACIIRIDRKLIACSMPSAFNIHRLHTGLTEDLLLL